MIMMIQGHVIHELTLPAQLDLNIFPWNIWEFFRGLTAPVFLVVSGAVQVFANKRDSNGAITTTVIRKRFTMALILLGIGYFLVFPASKLYHLLVMPWTSWQHFFQINILQLIGITLLFVLLLFVIIRNTKVLGYTSLALSILVFAFTPTVHLYDWFSVLPEYIAPYLSQQNGSIFTIFPFTGFMLFGVAFGCYLKLSTPDKRNKLIVKSGLILGTLFLIIGLPTYYYIKSQHFFFIEPFKGNTGMSLIRLGCVMYIISGITLLYEHVKKWSSYYSLFGRRALFVYVIHLILLYGSPWITSIGQSYHQAMPLWLSVPIALFILISSFWLAYMYDYIVERNPDFPIFFRYSTIFLFLYLLYI